MRISYDREVDALYIRFKETTVTTKHLAEGIAADYDADGRLVVGARRAVPLRRDNFAPSGMAIQLSNDPLGDPSIFKQVILEDVTRGSS